MEAEKRPAGRPPKEKEGNNTSLVCSEVVLHAAITIDGRTEQRICKTKIPSLKSVEWTPNGFILIRANKTHILPGAAVKDSILE